MYWIATVDSSDDVDDTRLGIAPPQLDPAARQTPPRNAFRSATVAKLDLTDRSTILVAVDTQTESRQRILTAARDLIHARSYTDVGVAEICAQAGVRKGSFYHYFPSKRDLTLAVLDLSLAESKERLLDRAFDSRLPPLQRFDRLAELSYELQKERYDLTGRVLGCPVGNLATELATQDEPIRVATACAFARMQELIGGTLAAAVAAGELPEMDLAATAQAMVAYYEGVLMLAKTENDLEVIRRLLPSLRHIRVPKTTI